MAEKKKVIFSDKPVRERTAVDGFMIDVVAADDILYLHIPLIEAKITDSPAEKQVGTALREYDARLTCGAGLGSSIVMLRISRRGHTIREAFDISGLFKQWATAAIRRLEARMEQADAGGKDRGGQHE